MQYQQKLDDIERRFDALNAQMADAEVISDPPPSLAWDSGALSRDGRAAGPGAADADGPVRQRLRRPGRDLLDLPGAGGGRRW